MHLLSCLRNIGGSIKVLGAEAVACFAAAVHGIILIFFEDS
jgi:hypothetical protein